MNIEQFEIFKTITEVKSFTKAAKKLNFTQPAISTQIKILEQNYDIALFERHNHGVQLTEAGQKFFEYGDKILALYEEMEQELAKIKGHSKEIINIAACDTAGNYILPSIVISFKELHPRACLRLEVAHFEDIINKLKQKQLDIGIIDGELPEENKCLSAIDIYSDDLVLVVPHRHKWLKRTAITVEELMAEPFIAREERSCIRNIIDSSLEKLDLSFADFNLVTEFNNFEAIKQAVINHKGVALMPASVVQRELDEGSLFKVNVENLKTKWKIKAVWRNNELMTGIKKQFLDFVSNIRGISREQRAKYPERKRA
ncbi:LysR family transcriptional regulator [Syntrophomonas curvata]